MKKTILGFCLAIALAIGGIQFFSAAYADNHAVTSEQVTLPVLVIDNFDTVCAVDVAAKHEEDFLRDEQMASDVIVQSERNLHRDSVWLLGLSNQYLKNQYRRQ